MCPIAGVTAQTTEFTKGTYTSHRVQDPSATIAMTFGDEGKLTVKVNGQTMVEGKYTVKGDRLEFLDQTGPMGCETGQNATYTWKLDGKKITFKPLDDKCDGRRNSLTTNEWTLSGGVAPDRAIAQAPPPKPIDISGKWTASFDTQIGTQNYTYEFTVKDGALSGKITSNLGPAKLTTGKVEGDKITFTEILTYMEMEITITYTGKSVSADEIKFTRNVMDFATEELVARRVKS